MKKIIKAITVYNYSELSNEAKEKVKQWYLDDPIRTDLFSEDCNEWYVENFPNSELKASYSLSYCQGDGYNTIGTLCYEDAIDKLDLKEKNKKILHSYFDNSGISYVFCDNNRYGYSCKFLDKKGITGALEDIFSELEDKEIKLNKELLEEFLVKTFDYFEDIDKTFKEDGYKYFYEVDEEEISEACEANEWMFREDGTFYKE